MPAAPADIHPTRDELAAHVSQTLNFSSSPSMPFQSPPNSYGNRVIPLANTKHLKPFATQDVKVLLLENVNQTGREILTQQGYQVEFLKSSLPEDQLIEKIRSV